MEKIEALNRIVHNGIDVDIFIAERSYAMYKIIGEYAERIKANGKYGPFFGITQEAFKDQYILAVARLYDRSNSRYDVRCIQELLDFLSENKELLPEIHETSHLDDAMSSCGFSKEKIAMLHNATTSQITQVIVEHFNVVLYNHSATIEKLKTFRDKVLAHNEILESPINGPTFKEINNLIEIVKDLLGVIGWAYMNMVYKVNGKYNLTNDAKRPTFSFESLMEEILELQKEDGHL